MFGFITAEKDNKDVFVHFSAILSDGYKTLYKGEEVEFDIATGPKGDQAADVNKLGKKTVAKK